MTRITCLELEIVMGNFGIGAVLGRSFTALVANFVPFAAISALVQIPVLLYSVYFALGLRDVTASQAESYGLQGGIILALLGLFLTPISTGALSFGVFQHLRGKPARIGECISVGVSRLLPVIGVAVATGILIALGFVALVIPGLIIICMLFVAVPAAVIEGMGVGASLGRSRALTKGHRGSIFAIVFVLGLLQKGTDKLLEVALLKDVDSFLTYMVATVGVSILLSAWSASASAVAYYDLRRAKESIDIEELAAVFD
jgi:hypothetical protein